MPQVKVGRPRISAEDTVRAIRRRFGREFQITPTGDRAFELRKNLLVRAKVTISDEPGGTVFDVSGLGAPVPLLMLTTLFLNNRGIARRVAAAIGEHDGFRDDA